MAAVRPGVTLRVEFNRYPEITRRMVRRADVIVAKTALDLEARMKARAPVDSGFLRASIQARRVGPAHWRVTVGAHYGIYVEYGTVRTRPQPYRDPAVRAIRPVFRESMRRVLEAG
jgi:HK97 gp10 family phage protein